MSDIKIFSCDDSACIFQVNDAVLDPRPFYVLSADYDALKENFDAALAREAALREELDRFRRLRCSFVKRVLCERDSAEQRLAVAEHQLGIQDRFAGYLLDHCEGEVIYEESLQYWLSESIKLHAESLKPAAEGEGS